MNTKNQINIFIVDDNKVFTLALKADIEMAFKNMFIKIYTFETGESCIERFRRVMPELVILDFYLNSKIADAVDGIRVLDWIKKENNKTDVIMLTSNDHIDIALESLKHGASDYVVKTETQFKKINYSLLNLFKTREAKTEARRYKRLLFVLFFFVLIFMAGIKVVQMFAPHGAP